MKTESKRFAKNGIAKAVRSSLSLSAFLLAGTLLSTPSFAQQGGSIKGKVISDNLTLGGITITATSNVMPKPRTAVTKEDGSFNLPLLLPGEYTLKYKDAKGIERQVNVLVLLDQASNINLALNQPNDNMEIITVSGSQILREGNSSLTNSIGADVVKGVPVGQDYRDLLKLIPGVQLSENSVLGPSAGGSGRDNKYGFDGVDVSLPMFGNLASEPSTHDVANVSMDRGGAKAVGFNRSGGFAINTMSKSGTNEFKANLEYRVMPKSLYADKKDDDNTKFEENKSWLTTSISGPLIKDELFFYGSFYRPETTRENKETAYGAAKDYESIREEYFGKLTYAPTDELLFNLSYRTSDRDGRGQSVGAFDADSTSYGDDAKQNIFTFDGSYIINDYTTLSFQYSKFELETASAPDTIFGNVQPELGSALPLSSLDSIGLFRVPDDKSDGEGYDLDQAIALLNQYGYTKDDGTKGGGGSIGGHNEINNQNFYRDSIEIALDHDFEIGESAHSLHFGFKWAEGEEVLSRYSNGWGAIAYAGGLPVDNFESDIPVYYIASVEQMSFLDESGKRVGDIESSSETFNFEVNDTIEHGDFTYNVGVLISKDVLYGQGLRENSSNVSGYELAPGETYTMHTVDWKDMIQPRLGVTWEFQPEKTVFANYAKYFPEASSLARAASWARNTRQTLNVMFDKDGNYLGERPASGSSGKFFQEGIKPRQISEYTVGATTALSNNLFLRGHLRHRKGEHFWEDAPNDARLYGEYGPFGGVPANIAEKGLYIPNLSEMRNEVGGSSYVIAELDGAFTKYWEASLEAEYIGDRTYLNVSYVWSNYYGNYDQDITSGASDGNLFIGSSNLADGKGRQVWDGKYGKLHGNKPHVFKAFGYYQTDWEANVGAYLLYQSGDVWETWDGSVYGYSSSTIRYSEPAGSRREASHWQLDLNYTQDFKLTEDLVLQFKADVFNIFDKQTGYSYDPYLSNDTYGDPRRLYSPRRVQLSFNIEY